MKIAQYFWIVIGKAYKKIYGEEITETGDFIKNILVIASGFGIASVISGVFTIYAGNILGPRNYGIYTLINTVTGFLIIIYLLGQRTALVNRNAKSSTKQERQVAISTSLIIVTILTAISCMVFLIFSPVLSTIFSVSTTIIHYAILLSIFLTFYTMGTGILESNFMMKQRGYMQILYAIFTFISFIVIIQFVKSYVSMLVAVIIGYIAAFLPVVYLNREYIKIAFDKSIAKHLFKYGIYSSVAGFSASILSYVDRLMLNHFFDATSVGLYQAYYSSSLFLPGFIMSIIVTVFFPTASRIQDKTSIVKRVDRTVKYLPLLYVPFLIFAFVLFKLYGSAYHFDLITLLIFGIDTILLISTGLYSRLTASVGVSGAKFLGKWVPLQAGLNVVLNLVLIPYLGINGAIGTTIVCHTLSTCVHRFIYIPRNITK